MNKADVLKRLGHELSRLRKRANLTVYNVAELTSIPRSTYHNMEHGKSDPSWTAMLQLCDLFDVPMSHLAAISSPSEGQGDV